MGYTSVDKWAAKREEAEIKCIIKFGFFILFSFFLFPFFINMENNTVDIHEDSGLYLQEYISSTEAIHE